MKTTFICEAPGWPRFIDVQDDSVKPVTTIEPVAEPELPNILYINTRPCNTNPFTKRRQQQYLCHRYQEVAQLAVWMGEMPSRTPITVHCFVEGWHGDALNGEYDTLEITINEDAIVTHSQADQPVREPQA